MFRCSRRPAVIVCSQNQNLSQPIRLRGAQSRGESRKRLNCCGGGSLSRPGRVRHAKSLDRGPKDRRHARMLEGGKEVSRMNILVGHHRRQDIPCPRTKAECLELGNLRAEISGCRIPSGASNLHLGWKESCLLRVITRHRFQYSAPLSRIGAGPNRYLDILGKRQSPSACGERVRGRRARRHRGTRDRECRLSAVTRRGTAG